MDKIDLNARWRAFLAAEGISSEEMLPETQRRETKKAFMGGMGQMFYLLLELAGEEDANAMMDDIRDQIKAFWKAELDDYQAKRN